MNRNTQSCQVMSSLRKLNKLQKPPKHEVFCQAFSTGIVSSNALLTIFAKDDET